MNKRRNSNSNLINTDRIIIPIRFFIWLFLIILTSAVIVQSAGAQITEYPRVEWVRSWPSGSQGQSKIGFRNRLNSILFGIKPLRLKNPVSLVARSADELWVLDQGNQAVIRVRKGVGDMPHIAGRAGYDFTSLVGICSGPESSILFTDSHACMIYSLTPGEKVLGIVNDNLQLDQPTGIAYSPVTKEIWVVETRAHRLAVLDESGKLLRRLGSRGNGPGEFNYPTHITIDREGNIYVTDAMNFRVQVLNSRGEVISVFGKAGDATGFMARPKGIATDSFGNIYLVDALFHAVQVFDKTGTYLYKFGNQGHGDGEFWMPSGIFIDDHDIIYVADSYNSRLQVFQLIHPQSK